MKTILVNYILPPKPPAKDMQQKFMVAAENRFKGMSGLHSKQFCYDETNGNGLSIYLWETAEQAEGFAVSFLDSFRETFGVEPTVSLIDTLVVVDNRAGDIIS